ncbi:hypothetical protein BN973_05790 [Mycobacterium triplex]|uniref:Uncharacterized protein n=1 Tax=Mycobacterium triplex TaxID=47839 RepID=A0A024K718_9MYCO|nr:hypothetical protein BN973_05790 [Mycobacterium triplex]
MVSRLWKAPFQPVTARPPDRVASDYVSLRRNRRDEVTFGRFAGSVAEPPRLNIFEIRGEAVFMVVSP